MTADILQQKETQQLSGWLQTADSHGAPAGLSSPVAPVPDSAPQLDPDAGSRAGRIVRPLHPTLHAQRGCASGARSSWPWGLCPDRPLQLCAVTACTSRLHCSASSGAGKDRARAVKASVRCGRGRPGVLLRAWLPLPGTIRPPAP